MIPTVTAPAQRRAAKHQILADLQEGCSVQETHRRAPLPLHPTTIYRLRQRLQEDPETVLNDGRHGHPIKLRGDVCQWVLDCCRQAPHTPSHIVQAALQGRFGLLVSISQLNRFRAAHGISSRTRGKKAGSSPDGDVIT
jgi:transposase